MMIRMTSAPLTASPAADPRAPEGTHTSIAIIGAGPRGVVALERLVAAVQEPGFRGSLTVHLIDPYVHSGGSVWRSDQTETLLMNTRTCDTTMYPDESTAPRFPIPASAQTFAQFCEADGFEIDDFAPRRQHGRYITAVREQALADAAALPAIEIREYEGSVRDIERGDEDEQLLRIEPRDPAASHIGIAVDSVIFALGHLPTEVGIRARAFQDYAAAHDLAFAAPANPLDVDYKQFLGREKVAVQGMGLNFYDALGMIVEAAGGRFEADDTVPHGLRYVPGGQEPVLVVGSRTGMVYRPKPDTGPDLPKRHRPTVLTDEVIDELSSRLQGIDYEDDVLPLIFHELTDALASRGFTPPEFDDVEAELFPLGRRAVSTEDAHARTVEVLRTATVRSMREPDGRWLALFRALTAVKDQVNKLAERGAFSTGSYLRDIQGFLRNALASWTSGPPVIRGQQLLALVDAGLVEFTGPGMYIGKDVHSGRFLVHAGGTSAHLCDGLLMAHLPAVDLEAYTSPLIRSMVRRGDVVNARLATPQPDDAPATGSIEVAERLFPVTAAGDAVLDRFFLGVPVTAAQPGSAITAAPGAGAPLLRLAEQAVERLLVAEGHIDAREDTLSAFATLRPEPEGVPLADGEELDLRPTEPAPAVADPESAPPARGVRGRFLTVDGDLTSLTRQLIDIESVSGNETALADAVEDVLQRCDHLTVERDGDTLCARTSLGRPTRVLLAGHLDTVPVAGNLPATLRVRNGVEELAGRGAADMKAGLAMMLQAAVLLQDPSADITLICYDHEEVASELNSLTRIAATRPEWLQADFAILGEPTNGGIEAGCKGTLRVIARATGTAAHSARDWVGHNAVHDLAPALQRLADYEARRAVIDGLEYREALNAVGIGGGIATNVIPDSAHLTINYRFAPDISPEQAEEHVREVLAGLDLDIEVDDAAAGALPGLTHPLVRAFTDALSRTSGGEAVVEAKQGWTDVARFTQLGVPAINFAPGDPLQCHTDDEHIRTDQLDPCYRVLESFLTGR